MDDDPVTVVDGQTVVGFEPGNIEDLLRS